MIESHKNLTEDEEKEILRQLSHLSADHAPPFKAAVLTHNSEIFSPLSQPVHRVGK